MSFRNIFISNPVSLSTWQEQLIVDNGEINKIPLEDINTIMLESLQVKLSTHVMFKLIQNDICVIGCDDKHNPYWVMLGYNVHFRKPKMLREQINVSKPFNKNLWKQIVIQKILNQAKVLELCGIDEYKKLEIYSKKVLSGDSSNIEGVAAAYYFRSLFGDEFSRQLDIEINGCLNYGYAIIRALIARTLVVYGLEPALGIHHESQTNSFNLADDIIEVFRPVVDLWVYNNLELIMNNGLNIEVKTKLFNLINVDVKVGRNKYALSYAIEKVVMNYSTMIIKKSGGLQLCEILPFKVHEYE